MCNYYSIIKNAADKRYEESGKMISAKKKEVMFVSLCFT